MQRAWLIAALLLGGCVTADVVAPDVVRDIAPSGRLRAAMNYGNPVLVQRGDGGAPRGVSPDIARELARRLGVPLDFVPYDAAGKVTADATRGVWDLAFVARDTERAKDIQFTPAYVVIEGAYMVRENSSLKANEDVDRPGVRIAVSRGSAYDLFLSRALKNATLVRAPSPAASVELFVNERPDALAGVKQPLVAYAAAHPGYRVLAGHFMVIEQAMAIPRGRPLAGRYLNDFIDELKASGFIAQSLDKSGQSEAMVAP
jgi:polar amino acid transport system substrate-binding protein